MVVRINTAPLENIRSLEEIEIDLLLEGIYQHFGDDFRGYERAYLKQKLLEFMQAQGLKTISALQDSAMHEPGANTALSRALSFHPVALFENAAKIRAMREMLGPRLRSCPFPKVWVADCSCAEEVFTLAIMLEEEGLYQKTQIFATDANEILLHEARSASFPLSRFAEYEDNYRRSGGRRQLSDYCLVDDQRVVLAQALQHNITWAQYNLSCDTSFNEFELITCHRSILDFGTSLRRRVLQIFSESLTPFAILSAEPIEELYNACFAFNYKAAYPELGLYWHIGSSL